jgi:hypothetical protein
VRSLLSLADHSNLRNKPGDASWSLAMMKIFHGDSTENAEARENCRTRSFMIYTPHQALLE